MSTAISRQRAFSLPQPLANAKVWRGLAVPLVLLAIWYTVTQLKLVNTYLLVRPDKVIASAIEQYREGELVSQLLASLRRDLLGFAGGTLVGLLVGAAMALSTLTDRLFGPTFHAAKQVAVFAWIPLLSVWLGSGETAKVVFIGLAAFYPVVLNTYEGIRSVPREYVEVGAVYRFSRLQLLRRVIFPAATPSIFAGIHLALIYSWLGTIGAEYLLQPGPGIGNLMIDGREQLAMAKVLLGIVIVGVVGATLNTFAAKIESHLLRWRVKGL